MSKGTAEETRRLEEASDWLMRLQEDALAENELAGWIDWCEADAGNRAAFERLLPLWNAFDAAADSSLPANLARVQGRAAGTAGRQSRYRLPMTLAATALLTFGATMAVMHLTRPMHADALTQIASLQSRPGEIKPALLPDGSRLDLGARSSVAIDFAGTQRRIELGDGEAFFVVKADKARPFVVRAGTVEVTAIGTQFNVLKSAQRIVVTVREGAVKVANPGEEPVLARAGHQVVYDSTRSKASLHQIDPASVIAWRDGHLEYISEPLSAIVSTLNRYSETPVALDDVALGELHYTGTIEVASIDEWLQALPLIFPVRIHTATDHRVRIERRP